jgi:BirA family biotin operon repressor/biotin-[acetyl-CoA-carboxylase] ligase
VVGRSGARHIAAGGSVGPVDTPTVPDAAGPWTDLARPPLRVQALRAALTGGDTPNWRALEVLARTGSTNADLAERARAGEPAGLVLATDHQVAGRGRLARAWTTPARSSITVSVLLAPTAPADRWGWLPLLAGLSVVRVLTRLAGLPAVLKWPNDVLVPVPGGEVPGGEVPGGEVPGGEVPGGEVPGGGPDLHKVCGILAEAVQVPGGGRAVVLGAGINVSQSVDELPVPQATSLRLAGAATTDRDTLLRGYLRQLAADYRAWDAAGGDPRTSGLGPAYREACTTIGRRVAVQLPGRDPLTGECEGVDDDGRLLVRDDRGGAQVLAAGDVVHVRPASG